MKILYIDMDGVLVDFDHNVEIWKYYHPTIKDHYENKPDTIPGIFRFPKPIVGAIDAINWLYNSGKYDMYIASSAPWDNPESSTDKRYWIEHYFGDIFYRRLILTHRKDLLIGDYLIDDRLKNGSENFKGKLIHFGSNEFPTWKNVLGYLL